MNQEFGGTMTASSLNNPFNTQNAERRAMRRMISLENGKEKRDGSVGVGSTSI